MAESNEIPAWLAPGRRIAIIDQPRGTYRSLSTARVERLTKTFAVDDAGGKHKLADLSGFRDEISTRRGSKDWPTGHINVVPFGSREHLRAIAYMEGQMQPAKTAVHYWEQDCVTPELADKAADALSAASEALRTVAAQQREIIAASGESL